LRPRSMITSDNHEFVASDRWKCGKSPSGAHHWIIQKNQMTCKYCELIKSLDIQRNEWIKPESQ
jgi:hypothetical protein